MQMAISPARPTTQIKFDWANALPEVGLSGEHLIPLKAACRLIPGRTGKGIALTTIYRWALRGCRGVKLQTFLIGGGRYTSRRALDRFVAAINERPSDVPPIADRQRERDVEASLDREGL
jgi:hypothetical protein